MEQSGTFDTDWAPFVADGRPGLEFKGELPSDGKVPLLTSRENVNLPMPTFYMNLDPKNGVLLGGLIVSDPVSQYLESVPADERKPIIVARDLESLKAAWPVINKEGKCESIVTDCSYGTVALGISWNTDL